jgi:hypothetical protein
MIERGLEDVGEADEVVEAERARAALDRMHGPKHGVHGLGIGVSGFNRE